MDRVLLTQGCGVNNSRYLILSHLLPRCFWHSLDQPQKDERMNQPRTHQVALSSCILYHYEMGWEWSKKRFSNDLATTNPYLIQWQCRIHSYYFETVYWFGIANSDYQTLKIVKINSSKNRQMTVAESREQYFELLRMQNSQYFPEIRP